MKPFANNRIDYVINLIEPKKNDRVLNIGVSNIPEIEMKIENKVKECWTIDIDKEKIEKAKKYLKKTKLVFEDVTNPKLLRKNYFDKIVVCEVLEHLKDDKKVVKTLNSLLKKNGKIIVSVPNKNLLHIINPVKYTQHERHYSNEDIRNLLIKNGFYIEHFNVVEDWRLLVNLYIHLFFKYVLRRTRNFETLKAKKSSYTRENNIGLDFIVSARKSKK